MLITAGEIKIVYSSKLLTSKVKNFQDSEKYMYSRQYIMNYYINLDIVGAIVLG